MARSPYRGFSTFDHLLAPSKGFTLTDVQLINRDLLNHINTIKGERVMMPNFGTRIPLMAFEPLDQATVDVIEEDLRAVFAYDPRVVLLDLAVVMLPDNNAIGAFADLQYVNLGVNHTLRLEFPVGA
jgi:phage baseplate assembly protein W